ncbi:MAG: membrane dipeptidase [Mesorhizobium sp.]|uniref:dipeptidase n=1 Tax=Mesorhizobium sp. TaxID=1871066 RepID=UPI000FE7BB86|nr:dipeptidase [Mesorhizobium sp.]RWD50790.1 MAG: membrane dipeptidase [Mesorhizobium sp.]RWE58687.1 MAG: membrane dipeptidase [Mesorhizobium sp.]RWF09088.1 MAG: membrane dipeptidase [Mesorhizobium sp.]RWF22347.1 MAG: membrane dipeptidase [Mesorhizobium sp.]TIY06714.1 MAG: membrane dipeptidase [Mesorhizobium sp.]
MQAVFDGHNDVLYRLWKNGAKGGDPVADFIEGTEQGHIDMPRARKGGLAGGLCAIYITSPNMPDAVRDENGHYAIPLCQSLERAPSLDIAVDMASIAFRIERAGGWKICRTCADIDAAEKEGKFAAVLHMEGCEAIDADLAELDVFYAAGLRSLGPVWSRNTIFGHGVPFAFPSSPDTGPGLTEAGKRLVKECNRIGIAIDLSHITEKGFWDVAKLSDQPLIASHSNAHAITPISRNLTDKQLAAVRDSNGLVGLNFAVTMLRKDGANSVDTPLYDMIRNIDYLVEHVGIDSVALGSDFDGATMPAEIGDAAGLQNLVAALRTAGYDDADLAKICRENWMRVLRSAWHEAVV